MLFASAARSLSSGGSDDRTVSDWGNRRTLGAGCDDRTTRESSRHSLRKITPILVDLKYVSEKERMPSGCMKSASSQL